jgi:hypothetical protein
MVFAKSAEFTQNNTDSPYRIGILHIPLPEYAAAASSEDAQLYGIRREKSCLRFSIPVCYRNEAGR